MDRTGIGDAELARRIPVSRQTLVRWKEATTTRPRYRQDVIRCGELLRLTDEERDELLLAAGFSPETAQTPEVPPPPAQTSGHPGSPPARQGPGFFRKNRRSLIAGVAASVLLIAIVAVVLALTFARHHSLSCRRRWRVTYCVGALRQLHLRRAGFQRRWATQGRYRQRSPEGRSDSRSDSRMAQGRSTMRTPPRTRASGPTRRW